MATTESTSTETPVDRAKDTGTAVNLMAQGKRNMICGEIPVAVNQFQDACQLLSKHYGEMAKECAEAYYCYGQSLLDLARMETGVLGNALQGVDVDDKDTADETEDKGNEQFENANKLPGEERDKLRDEVYDAMAENDKNTAEERGEKDAKVEKTAESKDLNKDQTENYLNIEKTDSKESREKDVRNETADEKERGDNADMKDNVEQKDVKESNCGEDKPEEIDDKESGDLDKKNDAKYTKPEEGDNSRKPGEGDDSRKTVVDKDSNATEEKEQENIISGEGDKIKETETQGVKTTEASCKENIEDKETGETLNDKKPEDDKKDDVDEEDRVDDAEEENMEDEEDEEDDEDAAENEEGKTDEEDPENVSNLQLAWEMLELAKMIYLKDSAKEAQLRAAQSHLKLGEVSLETEQYEQAISDFKDCLQIQEKHLSPEDRLIAESHYQLGLAYGFNQQYDESIDHYRAAIKVIENKIGKLEQSVQDESILQEKEIGGFEDPVQQIKKEIEDLKEILPDIRSKIEDTVEDKKSLEQLKDITKEALGDHILGGEPAGFTTSCSSNDATKEASDISHLIRKKRKPEDDPEPDAENKKSRQEMGGSGDAKAVENGVKEKEANDKTPTAMEEATTTS